MKFLVPSMGSMIQRVSAAARLAEFLAEEAPVGKGAAEHAPDGLLRLAVGLGHRRLVRLDRHLEAAAIVPERDLSGRPRRLDGGGERGMRRRSAHASHSPRSSRTRRNTSSASTTTGMPP